MRSRLVALLALVAVGQPLVLTATSKGLPNIEWQQEMGDDRFWYEDSVMAVSKDQVVISTRAVTVPWDDRPKAARLMLWRIAKTGEQIDEIDITQPAVNMVGSSPIVNDLATNERMDTVLLCDFGREPWFVTIDKGGNQIVTKELSGPGRQISLSKIVPIDGDNYLLIGHEAMKLFAMKIDSRGNPLWERSYNTEKGGEFVGGVSTSDKGGFLLVGTTGDVDKAQIRPSMFGIGKYDGKGNLVTQKNVVGQFGRIVKSRDKKYSVVYTQSDGSSQEVLVSSFNDDLKELWAAKIMSGKRGISNLRIASIPSGDSIIVGSLGSQRYSLWATRIAAWGNKIWDIVDNEIVSANYDLTSQNDEVYILFTSYKEVANRNISRKVGLIKFRQK